MCYTLPECLGELGGPGCCMVARQLCVQSLAAFVKALRSGIGGAAWAELALEMSSEHRKNR